MILKMRKDLADKMCWDSTRPHYPARQCSVCGKIGGMGTVGTWAGGKSPTSKGSLLVLVCYKCNARFELIYVDIGVDESSVLKISRTV